MKAVLSLLLWLLVCLNSFGHTRAAASLATLELSPGTHQMQVKGRHPSGQFTATDTSTFTSGASNDTLSATYDGGGHVTLRVWRNASGQTNRVQTLAWDAQGRLAAVSDRLVQRSNTVAVATNGLDWSAVYDAFGRLLRTVETPVASNGVVNASAQTLDHYYDPQVEFLELGVNENGAVTWKLLGPDADGTYGGQNGTGGLEAIAPPPDLFCPVFADARGNLQGIYDQRHLSLTWYSARVTAYGAVPGYRPVPLGQVGADLGAKYAWRNRAMTGCGLVYMGARYYDPEAGRFLSADPLGHGSDPSLYTFAGGDPVNYFDADGRLGIQYVRGQVADGVGMAHGLSDFVLGLAPTAEQAILSQVPLGQQIFGGVLTRPAEDARQWVQQGLDPLISQFTPAEGQRYAGMAFWGEMAPNLIPIAGMEKGAASLLSQAEAAAVQRVPSLGRNVGQWAGQLFQRFRGWLGFGEREAASTTATLPEGSFSIANWSGYPENLPKPTGPFRLLEGAEYDAARAAANQANRSMHQADPGLRGLQLHEIQPVKFGGSPTDPLNKIPLTQQQHSPATTWWNQLQRNLEGR